MPPEAGRPAERGGRAKAGWKKLVLQHHPDKGGAAERFAEVQEAYEFLKKEASADDARVPAECVHWYNHEVLGLPASPHSPGKPWLSYSAWARTLCLSDERVAAFDRGALTLAALLLLVLFR
ncbi:hypothetical protein TeGR_g14333, partial [Tetraparma gracilis]